MTIPFEKLKARLLANPKVKAEYDALAPEFEIAAELLRARLRAGLSQAELATRMGTSQSTIARLENGQTLPSTKMLLRYAEATGSRFHVRLSGGPMRCSRAFANVRYSGISLGFQLGAAIGGGLTPVIAAAIVAWSGGATWPVSLMLVTLGVLTLIAVLSTRETAARPMRS